MGQRQSLEDTLIELKLSARQMTAAARRAEKDEKKARNQIKVAIQKSNHEGARIYAQNAIRHKSQALSYLQLSSRIDAVAARLDTAIRTNQISSAMQSIVGGMHHALKSMDVEKIASTMDSFEANFEDMDVRAAYMEGAMNSSTAQATPQDEVDSLMREVAESHNLELKFALDDAGTAPPLQQREAESTAAATQEDSGDLAARLAALRK